MKDELIIEKYLRQVKAIADGVSVEPIIKITDLIQEASTIYLCGNGGSASNASHFACDLLKMGFNTHCLDDNGAILTMITNDDGFSELYLNQIKNLREGDLLICFSVHGGMGQDKAGLWSQNLIKAVNYTKLKGGKIIGFVGYNGGIIKELADVSIVVGNSTPQVESWHAHIFHLVCILLKERLCEKP